METHGNIAIAQYHTIPRNTARRKKVPNSPVGRKFCPTLGWNAADKNKRDALTKMLNIIWSHYMVLGTLHDRCWFGWAGFGEKTANTKFPLIPFPPNSFFFPPNSVSFRLNSGFSAEIPAKNAEAKSMFNIQHVLKTGPHRYSLIQKYKPVERCWEFNPVEIGPVGDAFKKRRQEKRNADALDVQCAQWIF